jgi:hypothetical protein
MPADAANQNAVVAQTEPAGGAPVAKEAPTEQQPSQPGIPKKITNAQTVCNEKNQKGKLCNGHLKQMKTGGEEAEKHLRGDDVLFKCQTCGTLYMGPPLGHVRDPEKQSRFVEKELMGILRAAGGTLPAFKKSDRGTLVPLEEDASHHAPAAATPAAAAGARPATPAAAKPASGASAAPANETPEERKARLIAEAQARKAAGGASAAKPAATARPSTTAPPAASTSGTDSSPEADRHRPAAEAQAATGQASAAPLSSAASTASPAAGAETVSDLAPEASTELTPGAPRDERTDSNTKATEGAKKE